jgi:alkylation response protein AidB-like acyl-CoA dehydrogenase
MSNPTIDSVLEQVIRIAPIIEAGSAQSESLGRLSPEIVQALHDTRLFRMMVPVEFGGLGLTLPEATPQG